MSLCETLLSVRRLPQRLTCDSRRTITRFFWPGNEKRARRIFERVMALSDNEVSELLEATVEEFGLRHPDLPQTLTRYYQRAAGRARVSEEPSYQQQLLIGAYFTMEYAFESAALFNPSMIPERNQNGVPEGATRFLMSLRAVGEGHVSSIVFRTGVIDRNGEIFIDPAIPYSQKLRMKENREFDKDEFREKLHEMGAYDEIAEPIFEQLPNPFTTGQLLAQIRAARPKGERNTRFEEAVKNLKWLAQSNYEIRMDTGPGLSELVLFPISEGESQGMEDMRLVSFTDDDGAVRYYGTYTAFDGHRILPQMLEFPEPGVAEVHTLHGKYAQNKGMALFPRKVNGAYALIGRIDGENLYFLQSDNIRFWNEAVQLQQPTYSWEFVQIGNCGSPIETDAGWLLLTHGVGPMRRYCIGAMLLDIDDPTKVIGQLDEPLLMPTDEERSGYVPNVVYSCGGMVHDGLLVIPYGISDAATGFATVPLEDVLSCLRT